MRGFTVRIVPSVVLLASLGCSQGQPEASSSPAATPAPVAISTAPMDVGLKVGETAPKFTLKDQDGQVRSLDEWLTKQKIALVFLRSIASFPHDRQHLADLQDGRKKFEAAGVQVVGISSDPVSELKQFAEKQRLPFPLLSDEGAETIKAYGVADPKDPKVALPGTVLIDQSGVIRDKSFLPLPQFRQTVDELVEAARKAG